MTDAGATAPRLAPLTAAGWSATGRDLLRGRLALADRYLDGGPDAPPMPGVLGVLGHHPRLAANWLALSGGMIEDPVLAPCDRELLILRVAWRTRNRYEWAQHARMAEETGLTADQVAAVGADPDVDAAVWTAHQHDLLAAVDQMIDGHRIDDTTWERLAARFDEAQLLELLFVVGSYLCLALVLNSVGLEPDPGTDGGGARLPGSEGA